MAKYDHGGGCACGLQKECDCQINIDKISSIRKYHKIEDIELQLAEIVAKKHNCILVPKKEIEQLIISLQKLL